MDWLIKHKLASFALVVVLAAVGWYMLSGTPEDESVLITETVAQIPPEARELLDSLYALQAVGLQSPIFTNPSFRLLKDFSTPIVPEPVGRQNPFAPLSGSVPLTSGGTGGQ